jgi:hypothetical protein
MVKKFTKEDVIYNNVGEEPFWYVIIGRASEFVYMQAYNKHNGYSIWGGIGIIKEWDHVPTQEEINYLNNSLDRPRDNMGM